MKVCSKCGIEKPRKEFPARKGVPDGLSYNCRACRVDVVRAWQTRNKDRLDKYKALPSYKEIMAKAVERHRQRFPQHHKARTAANNAIKAGKLIPWPVCAVPECNGKPEAHHPDYSRPLDVVWLCSAHHKQTHALYRRAA